jgi:hypothetical protein
LGGWRVRGYLHGYPRYIKALDIWIEFSQDNATRMVHALKQFGFSSLHLHENDFMVEDQIIQVRYAPRRIDIITTLEGVEFIECYEKRFPIDLDGVIVNFIDLDHLRRNKKAIGRYQDLADLDKLEEYLLDILRIT